MTEEEQVKLEKDLANVRDLPEGRPRQPETTNTAKSAKATLKTGRPLAPSRTRDKSQPG
jgi:hypothetical protein